MKKTVAVAVAAAVIAGVSGTSYAAIANPFTDVKESDYFYKPVLWAVSEGIANGYTKAEDVPEGYEYPVPCYGCDLNILREDLIVFLYRYAK